MRNRRLFFPVVAGATFAGQLLLAQTAPAPHKTKAAAAKAAPGASVWTPDVQQYLGVSQGSFGLVGLNKLSKAQVDALVNAAKNNVSGDPRKHLLNCGATTPGQQGRVRVLVTVSGDDPQGLRL